MKRWIVFFLFICLAAPGAHAQENYFYFTLDFNKPLSNTGWLSATATRGAKAGFRTFINERFSAGLDVGWSTFDQYNPTETRYNGNSALTTDYFKYIYSYSATLSAQYYFPLGEGDRFFPYAGLGVGANHNEYVLYYNIYEEGERNWGFVARPETGLLVRISRSGSLGARVAMHYDYSSNDSDKFGYDNFNTLGFEIGIILMQF